VRRSGLFAGPVGLWEATDTASERLQAGERELHERSHSVGLSARPEPLDELDVMAQGSRELELSLCALQLNTPSSEPYHTQWQVEHIHRQQLVLSAPARTSRAIMTIPPRNRVSTTATPAL
jgi:hypothetical protein